ncbi:tetratricopeptide repeat protein [Bacteroidota bacterium]
MKKLALIMLLTVFSLNYVYSQSAKEYVYSFAKSKKYTEASNYIALAVAENRKDFDLMVLSGDIYTELENLDSAIIMYRKADDIDGDETIVLRKIAKTLSGLKKHLEAIEVVKDAIEEDEGDVYNYLCMGYVYLAADSLRQAEMYITKAREMDKNIPDAYIALGDLYFAQRVYELAKNNYEEALSIDEENVEARTKLAISYFWLGMREYDQDLKNELIKKSLKEWNVITKKDTMNAKAFFEQGKILFFSSKWDKAAKSLYKYVQLRPAGSLGRWYLAQSLYELAQCDSAEPHLMICAEKIDSVKNKSLLLLARCYFDDQQYDKSIETFNRLKESDTVSSAPLSIMDLERFGAAAFKTGDTITAINTYKEVIEQDPSKCKLIYKTGVMLTILKNYDESIDMMKKRLDKCEDEFTNKTYFYIGSAYLKKEKPDSSKVFFLKSFEKDSTDFLSLLYLSDAFAKLEEDDSATYYLEFVIQKTLQDTATYGWITNNAYAKLSNLYYKAKNFSKLKNTAQDWIKLKPETAIAYLYIATYYQTNKNIEKACSFYRLVIKYDKSKKLAAIAKEQISRLNCP